MSTADSSSSNVSSKSSSQHQTPPTAAGSTPRFQLIDLQAIGSGVAAASPHPFAAAASLAVTGLPPPSIHPAIPAFSPLLRAGFAPPPFPSAFSSLYQQIGSIAAAAGQQATGIVPSSTVIRSSSSSSASSAPKEASIGPTGISKPSSTPTANHSVDTAAAMSTAATFNVLNDPMANFQRRNQTPPHHHSASSLIATAIGASSRNNLKVEDALTYLDRVKNQFGNSNPNIYSQFLDIMKNFKSQQLDTPGVIFRVSRLFAGHPHLIVGFNAFLPPGYRIEPIGDRGDRFTIHTPTGQVQIEGSTLVRQNNGRESSPMPVKAVPANAPPMPLSSQAPMASVAAPSFISPQTPIEFNHAVNYVNKIKNRFHDQPEVYKQFLEILHTYQKQQKHVKEGILPAESRHITEAEVYRQVSQLFRHQEDLLQEFSQFLPETTPGSGGSGAQGSLQGLAGFAPLPHEVVAARESVARPGSPPAPVMNHHAEIKPPPAPLEAKSGKRAADANANSQPPSKRFQQQNLSHHIGSSVKYDVGFAETAKYGSLEEFDFFDKVRNALRHDDVYKNFLRCLMLFNKDLISKTELVQITYPFLKKTPELWKWFKTFLGCNEVTGYVEQIPHRANQLREGVSSELAMEIDYASCKQYGASYRALPDSYKRPICSGRTPLCNEVLNDTWVSFPSWSSEDTQQVASKKTPYDEYIYRTEDERFELDIVIETNLATIQVLENVMKKISRISQDELQKFRLDDSFGGRSAVLNRKAIKRVYGDKAQDIIDGLKRNPTLAVPVVLNRLKAKDEEWRKAQKRFQKIWREQNEKFYLKSLDHQALTFKQSDVRMMKSKTLLNQIETLYDERHEQAEEQGIEVPAGPHMTITYPNDAQVFRDSLDLLIYHLRRQTTMAHSEKAKMKKFLRQTIPDLFGMERDELSEDEDDGEDVDEGDQDANDAASTASSNEKAKQKAAHAEEKRLKAEQKKEAKAKAAAAAAILEPKSVEMPPCSYRLIFCPNPWYVFLRLHCLMCERLFKLKKHALYVVDEFSGKKAPESVPAEALKLRAKVKIPPGEFYQSLIEAVKNLLDNQIDQQQFEDSLREMFTIYAYQAFTFDKLISSSVRQLQSIVTDDLCVDSLHLWSEYSSKGGTGDRAPFGIDRAPVEANFQSGAEMLMMDRNCFKIYFLHDENKVSFELLNTDSPSEENGENGESNRKRQYKNWASYVEAYVNNLEATSQTDKQILETLAKSKPVFLPRIMRNQRKFFEKKAEKLKEIKQQFNEGQNEGGNKSDEMKVEVNEDDENPSTSKMDEEENEDECQSEMGESGKRKKSERKRSGKTEPNNEEERISAAVWNETRFADKEEARFESNRMKMQFVAGPGFFFYRKQRLKLAKESHPRVCQEEYQRFNDRFHQPWALRNVNQKQQQQTDDWLLEGDSSDGTAAGNGNGSGNGNGNGENLLRRVELNDKTRRPYRPYVKFLSDR